MRTATVQCKNAYLLDVVPADGLVERLPRIQEPDPTNIMFLYSPVSYTRILLAQVSHWLDFKVKRLTYKYVYVFSYNTSKIENQK